MQNVLANSMPRTLLLSVCAGAFVMGGCKNSAPKDCGEVGAVCQDGTYYLGHGVEGENLFTTQQSITKSYDFFTERDQSKLTNELLAKVACQNLKNSCMSGKESTRILAELSSVEDDKVHEAALACYCLGEAHENAPNQTVPKDCKSDPAETNTKNGHGHDDWYLASAKELELIYGRVSPLVGSPVAKSFSNSHYWSSSVISNLSAWKIYFGEGTIDRYSNTASINVRCLRSP